MRFIPPLKSMVLSRGIVLVALAASPAYATPEPDSPQVKPAIALPTALPPMPMMAPVPTPAISIIPPIAALPVPLLPDLRIGKIEVAVETLRLRTVFMTEVPRFIPQTPQSTQRWITLAQAQIAATQTEILRPQLIVVIDRAIKVQQLAVLVAQPDGPYEVIGAVHVSTGQEGRTDHYITPTGVFRHTDAILDYRAEGTYNENHIRGLGLKGMRVWDFGWQWARKGWNPAVGKPLAIQIRFEMHATDPAILEQRIGRTASQGCVRIPSAMNRFLDLHGVLDADYERVAVTDIRYRALLLRDRTASILAGDALVVIDSSLPFGTLPDQLTTPSPASNVKRDTASIAAKSG